MHVLLRLNAGKMVKTKKSEPCGSLLKGIKTEVWHYRMTFFPFMMYTPLGRFFVAFVLYGLPESV